MEQNIILNILGIYFGIIRGIINNLEIILLQNICVYFVVATPATSPTFATPIPINKDKLTIYKIIFISSYVHILITLFVATPATSPTFATPIPINNDKLTIYKIIFISSYYRTYVHILITLFVATPATSPTFATSVPINKDKFTIYD